MARHHGGSQGGQRGAHRAEPADSGPLATVGHVLGSTVPKRVRPPRPLRVMVVSGVTIGLVLFGYSTTQVYLHFTEPEPGSGASALPEGDTHGGPMAAPSDAPSASPRATLSAAPSPSARPSASPRASATPERQEASPARQEETTADEQRESAASPRAAVSYSSVTYSEDSFSGQVVITNNSDSVLEGWELTLGFENVRVTAAWEVDWEATGNGVVARQTHYEGGLAPGESKTVNFTAEGPAQTPSCSLNGVSCGL
ncbi:cellulose binding domain-containing protein [Marinactinospora thermotolerans]|uniref:Cellulose binding domain-containing protein n=1 Tax=Marinactinospora thermotolerans DSM 45154 TaxID=1122192 RepID=A0A1T4SFP0_9ACTN|nr:cellulose binding domain-containing protein [Marinactinospora thermotolerans]SKA26995.1 Cellulose binding domain-containing protein [Marinactinospora thermotolerans DSM 45154]